MNTGKYRVRCSGTLLPFLFLTASFFPDSPSFGKGNKRFRKGLVDYSSSPVKPPAPDSDVEMETPQTAAADGNQLRWYSNAGQETDTAFRDTSPANTLPIASDSEDERTKYRKLGLIEFPANTGEDQTRSDRQRLRMMLNSLRPSNRQELVNRDACREFKNRIMSQQRQKSNSQRDADSGADRGMYFFYLPFSCSRVGI